MKFKIYRTSDRRLTTDHKPCKSAVLVQFENKTTSRTRIRDDLGKIIVQDTERISIKKYWIVYIHSLDDLLELRDEVGEELIISKSDLEGFDGEIEIYDGYRE